MDSKESSREDRVLEWRRRFGLHPTSSAAVLGPTLESTPELGASEGKPAERLERAREEMRRIVHEHFGGDTALLESVSKLVLTGKEALQVLEAAEREPRLEEFCSLEAIVAFDGTRPSFLVKDGEADLDSSFSTDTWKTLLGPRREQLAKLAACVGRVEIGQMGIGTAFLVGPNLAMTNRHVAQMIASFMPDAIKVKADIWLDFGREHGGRNSWDRRAVRKVLFAGSSVIAEPVDHAKLDLALLEVEESKLSVSSDCERCLGLRPDVNQVQEGDIVIATGYPADWRVYVPATFQTEFDGVLAKLLEGESGSKRLAPGESRGMLPTADGVLARTSTHDATTINGNSGSPMSVLSGPGKLAAIGLHYGGQWQGKRTNWAHVLGACMAASVTGGLELRSALEDHVGIGDKRHG